MVDWLKQNSKFAGWIFLYGCHSCTYSSHYTKWSIYCQI